MDKQLAGRIAVVTGGTQGLGETTARLFAERGAAGLVICGRNAGRGAAMLGIAALAIDYADR